MESSRIGEWYTALMGIRSAWRSWWRRKKVHLEELVPELDILVAQAKAAAIVFVHRALVAAADSAVGSRIIDGALASGDWLHRATPRATQLEMLRVLVMAAKALGLDGKGKMAQVEAVMRKVWPKIAAADEVFDRAWETWLRDSVEDLRTEQLREGVW